MTSKAPPEITLNPTSPYLDGRTSATSQKIQETSDGGVELTLLLSSLYEIEPWVLSWGEHVRVVGPAKLKNRITSRRRAAVILVPADRDREVKLFMNRTMDNVFPRLLLSRAGSNRYEKLMDFPSL